MKTAMQELIEKLEYSIQNSKDDYKINFQWIKFQAELLLEKEKEQIQKAFSDGQETPINHPTLPHYSREEYYNQTYNQNK
jgi:predicted ATPase